MIEIYGAAPPLIKEEYDKLSAAYNRDDEGLSVAEFIQKHGSRYIIAYEQKGAEIEQTHKKSLPEMSAELTEEGERLKDAWKKDKDGLLDEYILKRGSKKLIEAAQQGRRADTAYAEAMDRLYHDFDVTGGDNDASGHLNPHDQP